MLSAVHQMLERDCMKRVQLASNRQVQQNLPEAGNQLGIPATLWVFGCAAVVQWFYSSNQVYSLRQRAAKTAKIFMWPQNRQ
jgi:hypothetical protein